MSTERIWLKRFSCHCCDGGQKVCRYRNGEGATYDVPQIFLSFDQYDMGHDRQQKFSAKDVLMWMVFRDCDNSVFRSHPPSNCPSDLFAVLHARTRTPLCNFLGQFQIARQKKMAPIARQLKILNCTVIIMEKSLSSSARSQESSLSPILQWFFHHAITLVASSDRCTYTCTFHWPFEIAPPRLVLPCTVRRHLTR